MEEQVQSAPAWQEVAFVVACAAGAAYGVVLVVKTLMRDWAVERKLHHHPWWWNGSLRVIALVVGALTGWSLWEQMPGCKSCEGWPWGVFVGAASGAACAAIVAAVKMRLGGKQPAANSSDSALFQAEPVDVPAPELEMPEEPAAPTAVAAVKRPRGRRK